MATYYPITMPIQQQQPTFLPPRQRRRRRVQRKPANTNGFDKKIADLTKKLERLMPKDKTSGYYSLQASYGQDPPKLLVQPTLDTDIRHRISNVDLQKLTTDIKKRLQVGAGAITKDPNGRLTVHLQFIPPGAAAGRAFIPLKHEAADTEEDV
nr:ORF5 [Carpet python nidovirus 1]